MLNVLFEDATGTQFTERLANEQELAELIWKYGNKIISVTREGGDE